jgi:endoglucanase
MTASALSPRTLCGLAAVLFLSLGASTAAAGGFVPVSVDDQAARMHRGMNILDDDPVWRDPAAARFKPRHFAVLRAAGFDTVRLNLHPFKHLDASGVPDRAWLATLDGLVKAGIGAGLTVILDEHDDIACANDADSCVKTLRGVWGALAPRYRDASNRLLFEILNEPHGALTASEWNIVLRNLLALIRATNPARNVVIGPADMNSTSELPSLDLPESDRHILVTVHYYAPIRFTLQGAPWVPSAKDVSGVTWGSDTDIAALVRDFDRVKAWSDAHRRPVFLGEFGVYAAVPMEPRTRWIARVARVAEAHGLPWAYWQMDTDFAAYDFPRDAWIEPMRKVLAPSD